MDGSPATKVHITNLGDLPKHECTLQETVTDLRIEFRGMSADITNLAAAMQELNARMEEWMRGQDEKFSLLRNHCSKSDTISTIQAKIEILESRVERTELHKCKHDNNIANILKILETLKLNESKREGSKTWEDRIWNIGQAVAVAIVISVTLWFMKGGAIS